MDADGHRILGQGGTRVGGQGQRGELLVGQRAVGIHTFCRHAGKASWPSAASHDRGRSEVVQVDEEDVGTSAPVSSGPELVGMPPERARRLRAGTRLGPTPATRPTGTARTGRPGGAGPRARVGRSRATSPPGRAVWRPPRRPGQRLSANPYAPVAAATKATATGVTFNLGVFFLLVCGIALMYGSVGSWVHVQRQLGRRQLPRIHQRHRPRGLRLDRRRRLGHLHRRHPAGRSSPASR